MRILGLPLQFVVVVVVTVSLTIFIVAWAADSRVLARSQSVSMLGVQPVLNGGLAPSDQSQFPLGQPELVSALTTDEVDRDWWEASFLLLCPLH